MIDEILSPEEGSCNSSRISNKSEKNMADFDGEEVLSEEELAHINMVRQCHHHRHGRLHRYRGPHGQFMLQ